MNPWLLALLLGVGPRLESVSTPLDERGSVAPAGADDVATWLRERGVVRADTTWSARRMDLSHGGWVLLLREHYAGRPVAGARMALRVGPGGRVRQILGSALAREGELGASLETSSKTRRADSQDPSGPRSDVRSQLWWPTSDGLVLARIEDDPLRFSGRDAGGQPHQVRRYVEVASGKVLAEESLIDEVSIQIRGWPHNPLTTPELVDYDVEVADDEAILLEDEVFRVLHCNHSEQSEQCEPVFMPVVSDPADLPADPPPLEDAEAHASWDDPYAPLQFMQFASRFEAKLAQWQWDSFAWDELDCEWQETLTPEECRVRVYTNVLAQDEEGVFPFSGAFYRKTGEIFMGQGQNADTSYDGDIVIHEIGHHVTWSFGSPEPTETEQNVERLFTDVSGINEASSDFFARMMGPNDRIYDYYSETEPGVYNGPRIRDVGIPFACPQNVVGEVHMDGRIWVSALMEGFWALEDAALADADTYAETYLAALGPIRHIPREQKAQMADARAIFLDELELSSGAEAREVVEAVFDERGVGVCDYVIDLREEPSITGEGDPESNPLDARFMVLASRNPFSSEEAIQDFPRSPPVQHQITLAEDEGGVALSFRPNLWRPPRPVDDIEFRVAALVKQGAEPIYFFVDPEAELTANDAELRFDSTFDGARERVEVTGLEPGETYTIAIVSMSTIQGDKFTMEEMEWELLDPLPDDGSTDGGDGSEDGDGGTGGSEDGSGDASQSSSQGGCGCMSAESSPRPSGPWWLMLAWLARRRQRSRTSPPGAPHRVR